MSKKNRPTRLFLPKRRSKERALSAAVSLHFGAWLIATLALLLIKDEPTKMALVAGLYIDFRRTASGARRSAICELVKR